MNTLLPLLFQAAPPPNAGGRGLMITLWYIIGFGFIFYFFFIRPQRKQQKQHEEMITQLKKGDQVVTAGGIVGEVVHLKDDHITIKSGETRIIVLRGRISRVGNVEAPGASAGASTT
ncbi:MAG: preprotein translocase subunit YajC [Gemmatimonadales bacterium]